MDVLRVPVDEMVGNIRPEDAEWVTTFEGQLKATDFREILTVLSVLLQRVGDRRIEAIVTLMCSELRSRLIHMRLDVLRFLVSECGGWEAVCSNPLLASVVGRAQYLIALHTGDQSQVEDGSLLHVLVDCVIPSARVEADSVQWLNREILGRILSIGMPDVESFRLRRSESRWALEALALLFEHTMGYDTHEYGAITTELLRVWREAIHAGLRAGGAEDYVTVLLGMVSPFADFWDEACELFHRAPHSGASLLLLTGAPCSGQWGAAGFARLYERVNVLAGLIPFFRREEECELAQSAFECAALCLRDPGLVPGLLAQAAEADLSIDASEVNAAVQCLVALVLRHEAASDVIDGCANIVHAGIVQVFLAGLAGQSDRAWLLIRSSALSFEQCIRSTWNLAARLLRVVAIRARGELAFWSCVALDAHGSDRALLECLEELEIRGEPAPTALELATCECPLPADGIRLLLRRSARFGLDSSPNDREEMEPVGRALMARVGEPVAALVGQFMCAGVLSEEALVFISETSLGLLADLLAMCGMHQVCAAVVGRLLQIDTAALADFVLSVLAAGGRIDVPIELETNALVALAARAHARSRALPAIEFLRVRFCQLASLGSRDATALMEVLAALDDPAEAPREVVEAMLWVAFTMDSPALWPGPVGEFIVRASARPDVECFAVLDHALGALVFPGRERRLADEAMLPLGHDVSTSAEVALLAGLARDVAALRDCRCTS